VVRDQLCCPPARRSGWAPTWGKSTFWKRADRQGFAPRWWAGRRPGAGSSQISQGLGHDEVGATANFPTKGKPSHKVT
jgi:hypothetical protein